MATARIASSIVAVALCACTAGSIDVAGFDPASLTNGIVAYWPMDEAVGSVIHDSSTGNHDGNITGAVFVPGKFGSALHFEPGDEVRVPAFPSAQTSWTVAMWVRLPANDPRFVTLVSTEIPFVGGWEMNANMMPAVPASSPFYEFGYFTGPNQTDYLTRDCHCIVAGEWVHVAAVVDLQASPHGALSFFKNGKQQGGPTDFAVPIMSVTGPLYMGRWSLSARQLKGDLDDVVVYMRALLPVEIQALASGPVPKAM